MQSEITKRAVGAREAAASIGVSKETIRRMIRLGQIKIARIGRRVVIPVSELDRITRPAAQK
jgi:excisionase family DNA binding protein